MPYKIIKIPNTNLFKVCKANNPNICFSKKGLTKTQAIKQMYAIMLNEHLNGHGKENILNNLSNINGLYLVGSANRNEDYKDLDFITKSSLQKIIKKIISFYPDTKIKKLGLDYVQLQINNVNIDIWKAENQEELEAMKIMRTIEKGHNIAYRKKAKKLNLLLNDKGLFDNDQRIKFKSEKELRNLLKIDTDNYKINSIIFKKPYDLEQAKNEASQFIKGNKKYYRETDVSYRFRDVPKTKFIKSSFKTKVINPKISIIYGKLK